MLGGAVPWPTQEELAQGSMDEFEARFARCSHDDSTDEQDQDAVDEACGPDGEAEEATDGNDVDACAASQDDAESGAVPACDSAMQVVQPSSAPSAASSPGRAKHRSVRSAPQTKQDETKTTKCNERAVD